MPALRGSVLRGPTNPGFRSYLASPWATICRPYGTNCHDGNSVPKFGLPAPFSRDLLGAINLTWPFFYLVLRRFVGRNSHLDIRVDISPRSGGWRKALGGAKRNPRSAHAPQEPYSPQRGRRLPCPKVPPPTLWAIAVRCSQMTWGSARTSLHPRLYAITRFAGYSRKSTKSENFLATPAIQSPVTVTIMVRSRGLMSHSRWKICCQVPSTGRPSWIGTVRSGPSNVA